MNLGGYSELEEGAEQESLREMALKIPRIFFPRSEIAFAWSYTPAICVGSRFMEVASSSLVPTRPSLLILCSSLIFSDDVPKLESDVWLPSE